MSTAEGGRPDRTTRSASLGRRAIPLIALLLVLLSCAWILARTADYGLLGHDTYPIIASSRVESLSDLAGNFTERLMDGRYSGAFYRPLLNWSFALDYALWGLNASGYQLTNVLLFGCCALALFALARRLTSDLSWSAPFVTLVAFLVHPTHYEVIPVPARRPEMLCCAFMALSIWFQLSPSALRSERAPLLPALATLGAIASKESGLVLPVLSFLVVLLYAREMTPLGRLQRAWRCLGPHAAVVGLMLLLRWLVLGGLGGHRALAPSQVAEAAPAYLATLARELILPQPVMRQSLLAPLMLLGLTLGFVVTGVMLSLRRPTAVAARWSRVASARILLVALVWILVVGVTYAAAGWLGPWYFLIPVGGASLLVGGLFTRFLDLARGREGAVRWPAAVSLALLCLLLAWQARYSPLLQRYDEWERATRVGAEFLDESARRIALSSPGSVVLAPPLPVWVRPAEGKPTLFGAAVLNDYSVQAWADLTLRDKRVLVRRAPAPRPGSDEILLLISSRLPGY
jgi:hypothetical protein